MRRALLAAAALLTLASCATQERPEGIVERWLLALNQGSAGDPGRYAPAALSEEILPGWQRLDPGELDIVEVGSANIGFCAEALPPDESCPPGRPAAIVPFRVERLDGRLFDLDAHLVDRGAGWHVVYVDDYPRNVPTQGGPPLESATTVAWLLALGIGLGITLLSEVAMRLTRARATD